MGTQSEESTIKQRRRVARLTNCIYHMLRIFPIKNNKIVFTTFEGDGGYCCNPRYIAEEILKRNKGYGLVWLVNNMDKQFPEGIRKVRNTFFNRAYHLVTAKVWIDNSRKAYGTAKRDDQVYIQTWHAAIAFKPVGKFRGKLFPKIAYLVSRYDSKLADYVISNSDWCTRRYPKMLLYDGQILKTGSPRCDIFFTKRDEIHKKIRNRYSLPSDAKIVTFAPTFRGGSQKGKRQIFSEKISLDFKMLTEALEKKFGGTWYVFLRLHPQLAAQFNDMPISEKTEHMIDVSQADDMNELLTASDVLVTDYSSTAFDAVIMYMPVFLYADDIDEYTRERGSLMWDMDKLPFPVAKTNDELSENIRKFDEDSYKIEIDKFAKKHGILEDGHASERVVDVIERFIDGEKNGV